jgi:hypothetical protein
MSVILATWEAEIRRIEIWGQPRQIVWGSHLQNIHSKWIWGVAQVVEYLLCKYKALSSNTNATHTQKSEKRLLKWEIISCSWVFCLFLYWGLNPGLPHTRQALHHLNLSPSPFVFILFLRLGFPYLCLGWPWTFGPPGSASWVAGITGVCKFCLEF